MQRSFLALPYFAVVGASKDQTKWGTKVLKWYKDRSFSVTPIHPSEEKLEGLSTLKSISDLPHPKETAISIITRPSITLEILKTASSLGVPSVWLQPGAEDHSVIEYLESDECGIKNKIYGGSCILVEGDDVVRSLL